MSNYNINVKLLLYQWDKVVDVTFLESSTNQKSYVIYDVMYTKCLSYETSKTTSCDAVLNNLLLIPKIKQKMKLRNHKV